MVRAAAAKKSSPHVHEKRERRRSEIQHAALRALGCTCGQGYWYSRPLPPAEIGRQLAAATTGGTRALPVAC